MYDFYNEIVTKLKPQDTLFILGDVVDRGSDGIKIILDIIERQKLYKENSKDNPEIVFICGNHEWQFYRHVEMFMEAFERLPFEEREECSARKRAKILCEYFEKYEDRKQLTKKSREEVKKIISRIRKAKKQGKIYGPEILMLKSKISLYRGYNSEKVKLERDHKKYIEPLKGVPFNFLKIWLYTNQGKSTFLNFMDETSEKRKEIMSFILDSKICCSRKIGNKKYFFAHSMPPKKPEQIEDFAEKPPTIGEVRQMYDVWKHIMEEREDERTNKKEKRLAAYDLAYEMGYTTVCGHTPNEDVKAEYDKQGKRKKLKYINIDTGCGYPGGKLTIFCLDSQR